MLQDPKPPVNPKETSLMTHPDTSINMYDISIYVFLSDVNYFQTNLRDPSMGP